MRFISSLYYFRMLTTHSVPLMIYALVYVYTKNIICNIYIQLFHGKITVILFNNLFVRQGLVIGV